MPKYPFTLFASDVHLSPLFPKQWHFFRDFLDNKAVHAEALYLLGDLFDAWAGEDLQADFLHEVLSAFQKLTCKLPVYFMGGNRDFLCTKAFLAKAGIVKLADPTLISLYGTPTLLCHGDLLCTLDKKYQRYRRVAQNPIIRSAFLNLPRRYREKITQNLRSKSKAYQHQQASEILDVTPHAVLALMQKHQVQYLIHGHVHRPQFHKHATDNGILHRLVLGDWYQHHGSYIQSTNTGHQLYYFDTEKTILKNELHREF